MLKIILILLVLDIANTFLVYKHAEKKLLNPSEWAFLSFVLFVLVWIPLIRTQEKKPGAEIGAAPQTGTVPQVGAVPQEEAKAGLGVGATMITEMQGASFQPPPTLTPIFAEAEAPPAPLTPLVKPESSMGVGLAEFKPKTEITQEEYASGREKK